MYEMDRVVYHCSAGGDGLLKLSTALEMMMDCCQFQEYAEEDFSNWLRANDTAVFLASIQTDVIRRPSFREKLHLKVVIYDCKSIYGFRRITMRDEQGKLCMISNSIGAFFSFRENKAIKLPEEVQTMLTKDPAEPMECLPRKIMVPNVSWKDAPALLVTPSRIDLNKHLTSSEYFGIMEDSLPEGFQYTRVRAEFKQQTKVGTVVVPRVYLQDNGTATVALRDTEGSVHAVMEFSNPQI